MFGGAALNFRVAFGMEDLEILNRTELAIREELIVVLCVLYLKER